MRTLMRRIRGRLTFANTTSLLALFVALGGTSYAASVAANSVGSHQIRSGAVGRSEIRAGAVGPSEIRYSGVHMSDIAPRAVGKSEIASRAVAQSEIRNDAVGQGELRDDSVGAAEIQPNAVGTTELQDGGVALADLAPAVRTEFTLGREAVTKAGAGVAGNATAVARTGTGTYTLTFGRDVSACQYAATLATVKNGATVDTPDPGQIVVRPGASTNQVDVATYFGQTTDTPPQPQPADEPFHLIVAC